MRRCAILFALTTAFACGSSEDLDRPTRVVFITIDTLRLDAFTEAHMPRTMEFARRGQVFANAFAASSTTQPTHASLLTGLHPWQHGVTRNGLILSDEQRTVAEALREAQFSTSAVVSSAPLRGALGWRQGFEAYEDAFDQDWADQAEGTGAFYSLARSATDRALAALDEQKAPKQFHWFHFFDPHDPYGDAPLQGGASPSSTDDPAIVLSILKYGAETQNAAVLAFFPKAHEQYLRDVASMDAELGRLYDRLEADADQYVTHVVFTADHGESFGEQGSIGHGRRVSPEQVRVPLFIVSPRIDATKIGADDRQDTAGSIDIPRTLLDLAGEGGGPFQGRSLLVADPAAGAFGMRRTFVNETTEQLLDGSKRPLESALFFAVHRGTHYAGNSSTLRVDDDPARTLNASAGNDPVIGHLSVLFGSFESQLSGAIAAESDDPTVRKALEALGYAR